MKRTWDKEKGSVLFILLNPSTQVKDADDSTNKRGIQYAIDWGFGSVVFCNLFAYRTPEPARMKLSSDPVGPDNDHYLAMEALAAQEIILAWGIHGPFRARDQRVLDFLDALGVRTNCLGVTKDGHPKHILYLRKDAEREPFERRKA